jgi:hypothetical protein
LENNFEIDKIYLERAAWLYKFIDEIKIGKKIKNKK